MSNLRKAQRLGIVCRLVLIFPNFNEEFHSTDMSHQPTWNTVSWHCGAGYVKPTEKLGIDPKARGQIGNLLGLVAILSHQHP